MPEPEVNNSAHEQELVRRLQKTHNGIKQALAKRIVGQDEVIDQIMITLFSGGHCLLVGVPGLAKTLIIKSLSELLDLSFNRVQFTPDLMPSDITGTMVISEDRNTRE